MFMQLSRGLTTFDKTEVIVTPIWDPFVCDSLFIPKNPNISQNLEPEPCEHWPSVSTFMGLSWNRVTLQISIGFPLNQHKPTILGYPHGYGNPMAELMTRNHGRNLQPWPACKDGVSPLGHHDPPLPALRGQWRLGVDVHPGSECDWIVSYRAATQLSYFPKSSLQKHVVFEQS